MEQGKDKEAPHNCALELSLRRGKNTYKYSPQKQLQNFSESFTMLSNRKIKNYLVSRPERLTCRSRVLVLAKNGDILFSN